MWKVQSESKYYVDLTKHKHESIQTRLSPWHLFLCPKVHAIYTYIGGEDQQILWYTAQFRQ